MEISFIPRTKQASQFPGIFIFTNPARMVRPVKNLVSKTTELIGTLEQVYLHVALNPEDVIPGVSFLFNYFVCLKIFLYNILVIGYLKRKQYTFFLKRNLIQLL